MASVNMFNFTEMCRVAEYCSGIATRQALDDLTRPRGILDHIINFFTFGCMRRELSSPYEAFAQAMTEALVQQSNSGFSPCSIPERLRVVNRPGFLGEFLNSVHAARSLPGCEA